MNHKWEQNQTYGVQNGNGRPHGVDESWICKKCGSSKGRGPQSTHTGERVIRWTFKNSHENEVGYISSCIGYNPQN